MSEITPQKVTILGCGISGIASARYLSSRGYKVLLSDGTPTENVAAAVADAGLTGSINFEGGGHSEAVFDADIIVVSPGVPRNADVLIEADKREIPIIGELELGFQTSEAAFIAVTGSTGKSTTVSLIDHVFEVANKEHGLCGNIGDAVVTVAPKLSEDAVAICEVSSFQLETIDTFAPQIAVILNLAPNHLDRHASLEEYYQTKFRIVENMNSGLLILNGADNELVEWGCNLDTPDDLMICFFGEKVEGFASAIIEEDHIIIDGGNYAMVTPLALPGEHNRQNALVAALVAYAFGIKPSDFEEALATFGGLPHRMEKVGVKEGVTFYNDSKATTAESVEAALSGFQDGTVHLIAGGKDKGADFKKMAPTITHKCKQVYAIGDAKITLYTSWGKQAKVVMCDSLEEATKLAYDTCDSGDTVLLSPGCASFDMFHNFVDRGNQFKEIVQRIVG